MSYYHELEIGKRRVLGTHTFHRDDIIRFARRFDPQRFHLSDEGAADSHFGRLCASGWHTASVFMKLNIIWRDEQVAAYEAKGHPAPTLGPSPGFENLKWLLPVFAGDTLTYYGTYTGKRELRSRPGWGMINAYNEAENQDGEPVFSFEGHVMVKIEAV